jgi:FKBP-type peptidyl-prolyl cis-trans isomerase
MKHSYLTLFLLLSVGLFSCRKEGNDVDIKTYDQQQIQAYIAANGLTNMKRDMTDGDTTGIYYEILAQGSGNANLLQYETPVSIVYSIKSLSGKYIVADTIVNHLYSFVGRLPTKGLMLAVKNLAMYKGTRARFLIPSRLAYGIGGLGTGSTRLVGNESLDYYVNVISSQDAYDEDVIKRYIAANNLTGYVKSDSGSGLYYKVVTPGTGTVFPAFNATVTTKYVGSFLNGTDFDNSGQEASFILNNLGAIGFGEGVQKGTAGAHISMLLPSKLGYGVNGSVNQATGVVTIPPNSILRFEVDLLTVTNP